MDELYYVIHPVVEMRAEPTPKSEVVSQTLFSERIFPIEEHRGWIKIRTQIDDYEGWIKNESYCSSKSVFGENTQKLAIVNRHAAHLYDTQDTMYGPILTLPFESRLEVLEPKENSESRWIKVVLPNGREAYIQRGDVDLTNMRLDVSTIGKFSFNFLGLPYTWGGRSSFGYDCSGLTQMLYRRMGIFLPRDSKDQFKWNRFVDISIDRSQPGDLLFFGFAEDNIRHVGMCIEGDAFVHTCATTENAPYVRISRLSDQAWNGSGYYPYRAARKLIT